MKSSRPIIKLYLLVALSSCLFILSSCLNKKEQLFMYSRIVMDTLVSITVSSDSDRTAEKAADKAFNELARLEKLLNFFSDDSEVSIINKHAGERPVPVSRDTFEVIDKAIYTAENTDGAFDITIGAVVELWDFHEKKSPDPKLLKEKLKLVGYKNVILDRAKSTVFLKNKGMKIDLGGIAKGYASDRAVEVLKNSGIKAGIVAVAGDIKTFGLKPDGTKWNVGIKNPRPENEKADIFASIGLSGQGISTAGDYERFFIKDGVRYHHILDPKTGFPVNYCRAVSVIAKDDFIADAFDTGIFVLGPEKGMEVLKKMGLNGIITDDKGNIFVTDGIKGDLKIRTK